MRYVENENLPAMVQNNMIDSVHEYWEKSMVEY
jgi:hypothetical protein